MSNMSIPSTVRTQIQTNSSGQILGTISILCGLVGLIVAGLILGFIGIVTGIIAFSMGAKTGIAGIFLGIIDMFFVGALLAFL